MATPELVEVDPFDLPEWLGEADVTWEAAVGLLSGHLVDGRLSDGEHEHPCDLFGIDEAYPAPVAPDAVRSQAHLAWHNGQVLLVERAGRLALAVPVRVFDADLALDALARLAKAVGARPERYAARLRVGGERARITPDG